MRTTSAPWIALFALIPAACSTPSEVDNGTGGKGPVGGSLSSSGGSSSGAASSGGTTASGGAPSSGGVQGPSGGVQGTSGGVQGTTTGGTSSSSGGAPSSGGIQGTNTGGTATLSGGAPSTGGVQGPTGGKATGGVTTSTGGTPVATGGVGNCTDTPPPNGDTCAHAVQYGWCGQDWMNGYCSVSCGTCGSGTGGKANTGGTANTGGATNSTGGKATGGATSPTGGRATGGTATASGGKATGGTNSSTGGTGTSTCGSRTNPAISGTNGWASRDWDCCKPSCSWTTAVPSCQVDGTTKIGCRDTKSGCEGGGSAYECYDFAPWYDSSTNMSYGFAAFNSGSCGTCYELQFTGSSHNGGGTGAAAIAGQQMIVQVINIGGIEANQFDLLIPGGGVGAMTAGCTAQWGNVDLGATYGGLLTECNGDVACVRTKCASVFSGKSALIAGCSWFTDCYKGADNPNVVYKQVSCPSQITSKSGVGG